MFDHLRPPLHIPTMTTLWQWHVTGPSMNAVSIEDDLACQQMCHVIQMVTMPVIITVPMISAEQQPPPLIYSLEKQGPHRQRQCSNWPWTNDDDDTWCLWTTDMVEVSTITPLPCSFFHTKNRGHIVDHSSSQMMPSMHAWTEPDNKEPRWV